MRRIIYLLSGPAHAQNIVVSVHSLRKVWDGPVDVFVWAESDQFITEMTKDPRLGIGKIPWEPLYRGKSDTYVDKTRLIQSLPKEDTVLFLDADTTIHRPINELFVFAEKFGCMGTQWNDWLTTGKIISGRVKSLSNFCEIPQELIEATICRRWPSVNSGIFAAMSDSPVLPLWHEWTKLAKQTFIPDEKVWHLMQTKFMPLNQFFCAAGGYWNCSPMFQPANVTDEQVVIRHYHGDANNKRNRDGSFKSEKGYNQWWGQYQQAKELNLGGIADWTRLTRNRWIDALEGR